MSEKDLEKDTLNNTTSSIVEDNLPKTDLNTTKNIKTKLKKKQRKLLILIIILAFLILMLMVFIYNIFNSQNNKIAFENSFLNFASINEETIFSLNKCTLFSGVDTKNKTGSASNFTVENLYQYTDMAFFINNHSSNNTAQNTLKSLYINNIQYSKSPQLGQPSLYYKNINNFAKSDIIDNNLITERLDFGVTSENNLNFDIPSLYNNCANPIVISYVNSNIKTDYTITNTSNPITYDGSLLKRFNIPLSSIDSSLSFDIYITNNLNQEFKTTVYLNIPLISKDNVLSIYDGKYSEKNDINYIFYRYK